MQKQNYIIEEIKGEFFLVNEDKRHIKVSKEIVIEMLIDDVIKFDGIRRNKYVLSSRGWNHFNIRYTNVKRETARDTETIPEILDLLTHDKDPSIRIVVSLNTSTQKKTLAYLVNDVSDSIRRHVASHKNTMVKTLGLKKHRV